VTSDKLWIERGGREQNQSDGAPFRLDGKVTQDRVIAGVEYHFVSKVPNVLN